jgi:hypothetical protein
MRRKNGEAEDKHTIKPLIEKYEEDLDLMEADEK